MRAANISGMTLTADEVESTSSGELRALLYENRTLLIPGLEFDENGFWEFCSKFGTPWEKDNYIRAREKDIIKISDSRFTTLYHNSSYSRLLIYIDAHADVINEPYSAPLPTRALFCLSLPEKFTGGNTFLIDLIKSYKKYPDHIIDKYKDYEILYQSWQNVGTYRNWYKLLQHHPSTGEPFFLLNYCDKTSKFPWVIGFRDKYKAESSVDEVQMLIDLSRELNYSEVSWETGDLLVLDNIGLLHGRTPLYVDKSSVTLRSMWRCNISHNLEHKIIPVQRLDNVGIK